MGVKFSSIFAALKPKRRWFQFSLRTLFVVMTVFAVWLGLRVHEGRKQQRAIAVIEELSGRYFYYYDADPHYQTSMAMMLMVSTGEPPAGTVRPQWLRRWVPDEYLADIVWVNVGYRRATDEHLRAIGALKSLRRLDLTQTDVTDEGLQHLYGCKRLEEVYLVNSEVTEQGVGELQEALPNCKIHYQY